MAANKDISIEVPEALLARAYQATGKFTMTEALEALLDSFEKSQLNARKALRNKEVIVTKEPHRKEPAIRQVQAVGSDGEASIPKMRYRCRILDEWLGANSLGDIWAAAFDKFHELDPVVIDRLKDKYTSSREVRRYYADRPEDVHIENPHLPTIKTQCGKYVSTNISEKECRNYLKALCNTAGLEWGRDMEFVLG